MTIVTFSTSCGKAEQNHKEDEGSCAVHGASFCGCFICRTNLYTKNLCKIRKDLRLMPICGLERPTSVAYLWPVKTSCWRFLCVHYLWVEQLLFNIPGDTKNPGGNTKKQPSLYECLQLIQCVTNRIFRPEYEYVYLQVNIFCQVRIQRHSV